MDLQILHMAREQTVGRKTSEAGRLGRVAFELGRLEGCVLRRATSPESEANLAESEIFNGVTRNAADQHALVGPDVIGRDAADPDVPDRAGEGVAGPAHAGAEADKDRRFHDVPHRDVGDADVLDWTAVHAHDSQTT